MSLLSFILSLGNLVVRSVAPYLVSSTVVSPLGFQEGPELSGLNTRRNIVMRLERES